VIKRYPGAPTVTLPPPDAEGPIADVVLARRSWRRFGEGTIPLATFSTLLGLTSGVQQWVDVPGQGRVALKTSPSGGARHPIEVYVLAWRIDGLAAGLYHYAPDVHALESVQPGLGSSRVPTYLPEGDYWTDACALVLFSSVYEREIWRYHYSRAYRAPLVEAGHLCQTFCLLATSYGLAPFCAMALGDKAIEQDLQLDGISESVLYAAGVGIRPTGLAWAPAPEGLEAPRAVANPYLRPSVDQ
jgi:SagB-type dehydrogenase family enzyme